MSSRSANTQCDYCGLPVSLPLWRWIGVETQPLEETNPTPPNGGEPVSPPSYCCFGCKFAASVTSSRGDEGEARWTLTRLGLAIFLTMNVMVFTLVLWSYDLYAIDAVGGLSGSLAGLLRSLCLLLSLPVLILLGRPILESAVDDLRQAAFSTDLLVLAGVAASFGYSVFSVVSGVGPTYFEVGCMVLVMITLGRWLEATGKLRASRALDELQHLLPETVRVVRQGHPESVPLAEVVAGDQILLKQGERFPTDGELTEGTTVVDEQLLTGESWPVTKSVGDAVIGGSLNIDAPVRLRASSKPAEGTLARLLSAVQEARSAKGRYQRLADRVAAWFLPAILLIAVLTLVGHGLTNGLGAGLMAALAVVLVACPCALGLATPLAIWNGLGAAARAGVIFRSGETFERLSTVVAIRFDKTGTLTTGRPQVVHIHTDGDSNVDEVRQRSACLAELSNHVFCEAISEAVGTREASCANQESRTVPGLGVVGSFHQPGGHDAEGASLTALGSERLMKQQQCIVPDRLRCLLDQEETTGNPVVLVGWNGTVRGVWVFEERVRPEAESVLTRCRQMGFDVAVLTGDHEASGRQIAQKLGVCVSSGLLPHEKTQHLVEAQQRLGPVMMVGEGINDAPTLVAADVGVAMGCGADATRDSADICLLGNDLRRIPWSIDLARSTVGIVRQNLFWAFGYNSLGVVFAAGGWLHPALAAALMLLSSVVVIVNSLRLNRFENATAANTHDAPLTTPSPNEGDAAGEVRPPAATTGVAPTRGEKL